LAGVAGYILTNIDEFYKGKLVTELATPYEAKNLIQALCSWIEKHTEYRCVNKNEYEDLKRDLTLLKAHVLTDDEKIEIRKLKAELWLATFKLKDNNMSVLTSKIKLYVVQFGKTEFIQEILDIYGFNIEEDVGMLKTIEQKMAEIAEIKMN
jgi:hypothetical protein